MNLTDIFNSTATNTPPLMDAVKNGSSEMVKRLIELGADINAAPLPSSGAFSVPVSAIPMPDSPAAMPAATAPAPGKQKKPVITKMATDRQVTAPQTARFRKKAQPKRQTVL